MSGPAVRVLYRLGEDGRFGAECDVKMVYSTCKRPAQTYFIGEDGPFHRCAEHTRILQRQCDNVEIRDCPLR